MHQERFYFFTNFKKFRNSLAGIAENTNAFNDFTKQSVHVPSGKEYMNSWIIVAKNKYCYNGLRFVATNHSKFFIDNFYIEMREFHANCQKESTAPSIVFVGIKVAINRYRKAEYAELGTSKTPHVFELKWNVQT